MKCDFSFRHYKTMLSLAKDKGYAFTDIAGFDRNKGKKMLIILRHDIDFSPEKALEFARIENGLGISSTFFVRVREAPYSISDRAVMEIVREIAALGHEIGLHHETLDVSSETGKPPESVFREEKGILEGMLDMKIRSVAPHRDFTNINNMDFWTGRKMSDFGIRNMAYENKFMDNAMYVSDSMGKWRGGECPCLHVRRGKPRLYILTHPTYWR